MVIRRGAPLALLAALLALAGCGRQRGQLAAHAAYDEGARAHQQAQDCLAALDWPGATTATQDLQTILQRPDRVLVEHLYQGRTIAAHLEQWRAELRGAARARLPELRQQYLASQVSLTECDAWLPVFAVDDWPALRAEWLAEAAQRAAEEWRLVLVGDALPPVARQALLAAVAQRVVPLRANLGYDLPQSPPGAGSVTVTVSLTGDTVLDAMWRPRGVLPRAVTLTFAVAPAADATAPALPPSLALTVPATPADQPFADRARAAAQALADQLAAGLSPALR